VSLPIARQSFFGGGCYRALDFQRRSAAASDLANMHRIDTDNAQW
jgi:hypothetical protein